MIHDAGEEKVGDAGVAAQGAKDGDEAANLVGLEEGSQISEGGY